MGILEEKMEIKPIGDKVLVQRILNREEIKGGIIIPDSAKEKPQEGYVVSVGTGKKNENNKIIPFEVKKGDRVLISKYGGMEIKIGKEEYVLLKEEEILGIII